MKIPQIQMIYLDETESTNNYATALLQTETVTEGTVVLTFRQTRGRGQKGNQWESGDNLNLTFSIILTPAKIDAGSQFLISQAVSLGIAGYLDRITDGISVKWPNDIMIGDAKAAGILIENSVMGSEIAWSVAGVGLNLNQINFRDYSPAAVSLRMATGREFDPESVLRELVEGIMLQYGRLQAGESDRVIAEYHSRLYRKDQWCRFRADREIFEARIMGTDEYGRLLLESIEGEISAWNFKSVSMII